MKNKEARTLLEKYKSGALSAEEEAQLDSWYRQESKSKSRRVDKDAIQRQLDAIWTGLPVNKKPGATIYIWIRSLVAAMILISFSTGLYFYINNHNKTDLTYSINYPKQNIVPGRNKAILILSNGSKIDLDAAATGTMVKQAGLTITKTQAGQLSYHVSDANSKKIQEAPAYNTIETPRGGQYEINLSDGTKVWLNSASSLRYPTRFVSNERRVELTGEGYFEVAHNKISPFKVITGKQEIEVLGTHFNVNAYTDENAVKTTLLEGSVKITVRPTDQSKQQSDILKPGQQSSFNNKGLVIENGDIENAVAWKNGYFNFNEDIESIMRKLSRWYDIEVVYQIEKDPDLLFGGKIDRSKSINSVLNIIEATGKFHFKIEGRRVTVMK
jgi:transmembrane sensor